MAADTPIAPPPSDTSLKEVIMENTRETKEMTRAVLAMSAAIRTQYSVPLALGAIWIVWKALEAGKIGEPSFVFIVAICVVHFFGESFLKIGASGLFPWVKNGNNSAKVSLLIIIAMFYLLVS